LKLLCKLLDEEIRKSKEIITKRLTESISFYINTLFPKSTSHVNEEFCLHRIERDDFIEYIHHLSFGTREQLSILFRLAYADLLSKKDVPVMVVLDDSLVNTDGNRHKIMNHLVHRASQNFQIIILTCHEDKYRDSGGKFYDLNDRIQYMASL
jgi:wobble nucleotide-excising tRNase